MRLLILSIIAFIINSGFSCQSATSVKQSPMPATTKEEMACKLTSPELRERKSTAIASLQSKIKNKVELSNGFKYQFEASDEVLDELITFIKAERLCCDFFAFDLSIRENNAWLSITGPDGAKEFIKTELEL